MARANKDLSFIVNSWLLFSVAALLLSGLIMIFSATTIDSLQAGDPFYYLKRQLFYLAIGLSLMIAGLRIRYEVYKKMSGLLLLAGVGMLLLLFVPFLGKEVGGAVRWISIGPFSFQPSEFMKFAVVVYIADVLTRNEKNIGDFSRTILPVLGVVGAVVILIMKQPDMGTCLVLFGIMMLMFYFSGVRLSHLFGLLSAGGVAILAASVLSPYRMKRLMAFRDPWQDPQGIGYHITQSLIAVGSGGIFGLGIGASRQKFMYLPEQYTDFIFAIICEETGLIGALVIIFLFLMLIAQGLRIARSAPDRFGFLLASGIVSFMAVQSFVNISVVVGLLPTTGIPLPFISYGGTSLMVMLFSIGVLLNISNSQRRQK